MPDPETSGFSPLGNGRVEQSEAWQFVGCESPIWVGEFRKATARIAGARKRFGYENRINTAIRPVGIDLLEFRWFEFGNVMCPAEESQGADPDEFYDLGTDASHESVRAVMHQRLFDWFCNLKRRTTVSSEEVERSTHRYKEAGVFYGVW